MGNHTRSRVPIHGLVRKVKLRLQDCTDFYHSWCYRPRLRSRCHQSCSGDRIHSDQVSLLEIVTRPKLTCFRVGAWIMKDPSNNLLGSWGSDGEVWYQLWENGQPSLNTGANGLALLDSAVQQAEAAGIQLIMCLVKFVPPEGSMPFLLILSKRMAKLWRSDRLCQQPARRWTVTSSILH